MLKRINDANQRGKILEAMAANLWRRGGAESLLITGAGPWRGQTLAEVARGAGRDPLPTAIEIIGGGDPSVASFNMRPEDIAAFAVQDWVMTGSDGSEGHPRKYASYPKAYRDLVVDSGLLPLERFVHRSSGLVADTYGLCDRGYLQVGRRADIAIIDPQRFRPLADFENPRRMSSGVDYLLVNGRLAIDGGVLNDPVHGEVLDRQNLDCAP